MPSEGFSASRGLTLIELLVVIAIIALLVAVLAPQLGPARGQARAAKCLANLRSQGQGLYLYTSEFRDTLVPGRMPLIDDCNTYVSLQGRRKYRPNFLAMTSLGTNVPPFDDPMDCRSAVDRLGESGDRQNFSDPALICPQAADWTDERNSSYGYNYQFLGNSRLVNPADPGSYKNWPQSLARIQQPARTVAVADGLGTAASFPETQRLPYANNARDLARLGNEGFNLDPPRVDPTSGEMAGFDNAPQRRTAVAARHNGRRAMVLFVDGHGSAFTSQALGYQLLPEGVFGFDGENTLWTGNGRDVPWTPAWRTGSAGPP